MSRTLVLALAGAVLAVVAALTFTGVVAAPTAVGDLAPWVGFGGAVLLFVLAIRSRRS